MKRVCVCIMVLLAGSALLISCTEDEQPAQPVGGVNPLSNNPPDAPWLSFEPGDMGKLIQTPADATFKKQKFTAGHELRYKLHRQWIIWDRNYAGPSHKGTVTGSITIGATGNGSARLTLTQQHAGDNGSSPAIIFFDIIPTGEVRKKNGAAKATLQTIVDLWFPMPETELSYGGNTTRTFKIPLNEKGDVKEVTITTMFTGAVQLDNITCRMIETSFITTTTVNDKDLGRVTQITEGKGIAHFISEKGQFYRSEQMSRITYKLEDATVVKTHDDHTLIELEKPKGP